MWLNSLWVCPTVLIVCLILLLWQIGIAALAAIVLMLILMPLQMVIAKRIGYWRTGSLQNGDERIKQCQEIVQGIKVIKLYAWEQALASRLDQIRKKELRCLRYLTFYRGLNLAIFFSWPILVTYATFVLYSQLGNEVNLSSVFIVLSFLNVLRFPISILPQAVSAAMDASVALKRISTYLSKKQIDKDRMIAFTSQPSLESSKSPQKTQIEQKHVITTESNTNNTENGKIVETGSISIENGSFSYQPDAKLPTIHSVCNIVRISFFTIC